MQPLPQSIIEYCQRQALGQVLSGWGDFTYDQILTGLREEDDAVCEHDDFIVWYKYDDETTIELADIIEDIYDSYINCATFALKEGI